MDLRSGLWLRAATFGAMDGLVSNIALIAGVAGGGASPKLIILTGTAGLIAGSISMGLGEYTSVSVQAEAHGHSQFSNPKAAAIASFISFALGAFIPLLPYLLGFTWLGFSLLTGGLGLFFTGAIVCKFTHKSWWRSGLRQLLLCTAASVVTYIIGFIIGVGAVA